MKRFWAHVKKTKTCWTWTRRKDDYGYGRFRITKKQAVRAHRFALEKKLGRKLRKDEFALHNCDNEPCVRVHHDHVYAGTKKQNSIDMVQRRRAPMAKVTVRDVRAIRSACCKRGDQAKQATKYKVSFQLISDIVRRKTWRHVA